MALHFLDHTSSDPLPPDLDPDQVDLDPSQGSQEGTPDKVRGRTRLAILLDDSWARPDPFSLIH